MATSRAAVDEALRTVRGRQVDQKSIEQRLLDVKGRKRTNALAWRGQFTPGLPELMLERHRPSGTVLDPFAGSGTTLLEAIRLGLPSVGTEVNPAALSLSRVYELASLEVDDRLTALACVNAAVEECVTAADGLFGRGDLPHRKHRDDIPGG